MHVLPRRDVWRNLLAKYLHIHIPDLKLKKLDFSKVSFLTCLVLVKFPPLFGDGYAHLITLVGVVCVCVCVRAIAENQLPDHSSPLRLVQITDCKRHSNKSNFILTLMNYVQPC